MTDLQMLGSMALVANLDWYRRTNDLVPIFDPKVHLFENSLLKIRAQLIWLLLVPYPFYILYMTQCLFRINFMSSKGLKIILLYAKSNS